GDGAGELAGCADGYRDGIAMTRCGSAFASEVEGALAAGELGAGDAARSGAGERAPNGSVEPEAPGVCARAGSDGAAVRAGAAGAATARPEKDASGSISVPLSKRSEMRSSSERRWSLGWAAALMASDRLP